jgi:hypothetical protein
MTRETWPALLARATRGERSGIVKRLAPWLLVATPDGRANLRRWMQAGHPTPPAGELPLIVGDSGAVPLVARALALVPPCVRWHVIEHVAVSAVGFQHAAWSMPTIRSRPLEIRLSQYADVQTVAHEAGHMWHRHPVAGDPPAAVDWQAALAIAKGDVLTWHRDDELLADACALAWGAA